MKLGQRVKKGDLLFSIDIPKLKEYLENALVGGSDNTEMLYYISEVLNTKEKVESAISQLKPHYYAQKDGIVTAFNLENNALNNPLLPVVSIANSNELIISADIPIENSAQLQKGQNAYITLENGKNTQLEGNIKQVSSIAKPKISGTKTTVCVPIEISLKNINDDVFPGIPANVQIQTGDRKDIFCLSFMAIGQDEKGEYVYTYNKGQLEKKHIETGEELNGKVQILSGLTPQDFIVADVAKVTNKTRLIKVVKE